MTIEKIKSILHTHKQALKNKFKIKTIGIFGSYSRGDATEISDIDILVEFEEPIGIEFIALAENLEKILNIKVDLVSRNAVRPKIMKYIEEELIYV